MYGQKCLRLGSNYQSLDAWKKFSLMSSFDSKILIKQYQTFNQGTYEPMPNYLSKSIHTVSLLHDSAYFEQHLKSRIQNESTFVLPE